MPANLMSRARFVIIMREPIERLLSWYNHNKCPYEATNGAPWDWCAKQTDTFEAFATCKQHEPVDSDDAGLYGPFVNNLLSMPAVSRKQVLLLNYRQSFINSTATRASLKAITKHYGGPILDGVLQMPQSNTKEYPQKLVQIKCATRDILLSRYQDSSAALYDRIQEGYANGLAPSYEPRFERFVVDVPCGFSELAQGDAENFKLAWNGTIFTAVGAAARTTAPPARAKNSTM